jgi:hypothetical protein
VIKTLVPVLLCLFGLSLLVQVPGAFADYYKYTDSHGAVTMTNKLDSVPAKYRAGMKVIPEEKAGVQKQQKLQPEPEQAVAAQPALATTPAAAPAGKFDELSQRYVWFKPLVYLGVILAIFLALVKLTTLVSSPLLAKLIYLAFFIGVSVFIFKKNVEHVAESSHEIKEKATSIVNKAAEREKAALPD